MNNTIVLKKIIVLLFTVILFAACDLYGKVGGDDANIQGALPELLRGEWVFPRSGNPSEQYTIDTNTVEYRGYFGGDSLADSGTDYKANIRFVSNFTGTAGVIIIEYLDEDNRPNYPLHNGNNFAAVYYRNVSDETVQLANAINLDGFTTPDTATLEEAIGKFSRLGMGNFVDWGSVQPQWRRTDES